MAAGHRAATRSVLEGHEHAGTVTQIEMSGTGMDANTVLALGLGVTPPWRLVNQRLETGKQPHELHLEVAAERGSLFPCPVCGKPCKAHYFAEFSWRHLNFFQHHCYITAKIPRTDCGEHGVLRITAPWAREGSRFTLPPPGHARAAASLCCSSRRAGCWCARGRCWRLPAISRSRTKGCGALSSTMSAARSSASTSASSLP